MSVHMNIFSTEGLNACLLRQIVNSSAMKFIYVSIVTILYAKHEYVVSSVGIFYNDQYKKQSSQWVPC